MTTSNFRQFQAPFAGVHSFARATLGQLSETRPGQVVVFGVPYESTANLQSATQDGPAAIRQASASFAYSLQVAGTLVDVATGDTISWPSDGKLLDLGDVALAPGDPNRMVESLATMSADLVRRGAIALALGGDRYVTYPLFSGFATAAQTQGKQTGLIVLSSDLALAQSHPDFGPHWCGVTLRRILDSRLVDPRRIVVIGLGQIQSHDEWNSARESGLSLMSIKAMRSQGVVVAARKAIAEAGKGGGPVYLSVDIGAVESGHAPGRSTVSVGGLTASELLEFARAIAHSDICAIDVVGVGPANDIGGRSGALAAQAAIELIAPHVFRPAG